MEQLGSINHLNALHHLAGEVEDGVLVRLDGLGGVDDECERRIYDLITSLISHQRQFRPDARAPLSRDPRADRSDANQLGIAQISRDWK